MRFFPEGKVKGHDVIHSHQRIAEVKKEWSYTSTPLHGVDRNNFTFYFTSMYFNPRNILSTYGRFLINILYMFLRV
jgi:hypothetical protein